MASQPLNADISVHRRVRAYRQDLRHNSILDMTADMRQLIMSVPSEEVLITETRDGSTIVTTALDTDKAGLPVVRELRPVTTLEEAAEAMSGLSFPVRMPGMRDVFLEEDDSSVGGDLHQALRDVK